MFIYNLDEIKQIWAIFEMFEAMPEIDDRTKQKISERIDDIFQAYSDVKYDEGWDQGFLAGES